MRELEDEILREGKICPHNIVKVDSFLNHQIDINIIKKIGQEFANRYKDDHVNKILTIESSGIPIACYTAEVLGCRLVYAKKGKSLNQSSDKYEAMIFSYTRNNEYHISVSKEYIHETDNILIIDDFLANGAALKGLIKIVNDANAHLVGCGIAIEKGFQPGGEELRKKGIRIESLAIIEKIDEVNQTIEFRE